MEKNIGVVARNVAFKRATSEFIFQIDDDVIVFPGWYQRCIDFFDAEPKVGMIGQQGGLIKQWMDIHSHVHCNRGGYVDYLTGFFLAFRNIGLYYDEAFGFRWHEELMLSLDMKAHGYRLAVLGGLCVHNSAATGPIDWELHDRNLRRCYEKYRDRIDELNLEGMAA